MEKQETAIPVLVCDQYSYMISIPLHVRAGFRFGINRKHPNMPH